MKLHPVIHLAILAAGIAVAVVISTSGGDEQAPASAATPAPVVIGSPDAAPRISQPPSVPIAALPQRSRRTTPRPARTAPAAGRVRKPKARATTRRSPLKPAPLEPELLAPPE